MRSANGNASRSVIGQRRAAVALALLAALAAVGAPPAAWGAGLQVDEQRLDAEAVPGVVGRVTVRNPSTETIVVTLTPRRWRQRIDGTLQPDLRRSAILRGVRVSATRFTLTARASRTVEVGLRTMPAKRYLYGALVVHGTVSSRRAGLRPRYQIAVALSLRPPSARQRFRQVVSRPRARSRRGGGVLLDAVVGNRGNMVLPPSGTYTIRGPGLRRSVPIQPRVGVLPGRRVRLPAVVVRGLRAGRRYTVTVRIGQGSRGRASATGAFRLARNGRVAR